MANWRPPTRSARGGRKIHDGAAQLRMDGSAAASDGEAEAGGASEPAIRATHLLSWAVNARPPARSLARRNDKRQVWNAAKRDALFASSLSPPRRSAGAFGHAHSGLSACPFSAGTSWRRGCKYSIAWPIGRQEPKNWGKPNAKKKNRHRHAPLQKRVFALSLSPFWHFGSERYRALAEGALHTRRHAAHAARASNRFGCTSSLIVEQRRNVQSRRGCRSNLCDGSRLQSVRNFLPLRVSSLAIARVHTRTRDTPESIRPSTECAFKQIAHRACCILVPVALPTPSYDHLCLVLANMPNDSQLERRESGPRARRCLALSC
ncbi:hypothetical protein L1887_55759 [Cichorium endivia]|nr:hypothetical protein L1887_55759 [Cichorium endivia]